jgi:hypothetical protein
MKEFLISLLLLIGVVSCSSTTDVTKNPAQFTDFMVGHTYLLTRPAYVWKGRLVPKDLAGGEGVISAGTKLTVRNVVVFRSPEVGPYAVVYLEILSGEMTGRTLDFNGRPGRSHPIYLKRDPELFEPMEAATK